MNKRRLKPTATSSMAFSERYRSPIRCGVVWVGILALWSAGVLDFGQSVQTFGYTLVVYLVLLLLIMLRRPTTPSKLDLVLIGWSLPVLFFTLLFLFPLTRIPR